jgi:hypothetical protein
MGVPVPAAGCPGPNETPDTAFTSLSPVISTVCNADDSDGVGESVVQTTVPYGVREALSVFLVEGMGTALAKITTSASESHAVQPAQAEPPPPPPPPTDGPGGPAAGPAQPADEPLPFTGAQVLLLGLIGAAMLGTGLVVRGLAARRRYH